MVKRRRRTREQKNKAAAGRGSGQKGEQKIREMMHGQLSSGSIAT